MKTTIKPLLIIALAILLSSNQNIAQNVGIGSESFTPDPSAGLEVKFSDKGLLFPRLSEEQKANIPTPIAEYLMIQNTTTKCIEIYIDDSWQNVFCPCIQSVAATEIQGDEAICFGNNTNLTVIGGNLGTGANWHWYTVNCGGTLIGEGAGITVSPTSTTTYFVRAIGDCGSTECIQKTITVNTTPNAPIASTHISSDEQIEWNWNFVSGAEGYKYNYSNNYSSATDIGNNTSFLQTGVCGTSTVYVWAYNTCGVSVPAQFTYSTILTDTRDNNQYAMVKIGTQCWMKENLKYLPSVTGPSSGSGYYVVDYNGSDVNEAKATAAYNIYGVLYNWHTANISCPSGWNLPSDNDWKILEVFLGMSQSHADATGWSRGTNEGGKLKATGTTYWNSPNSGATNSSGFSAYGGDYRRAMYGIFQGDLKSYGYWWTSNSGCFRLLYKDGSTSVRFCSGDTSDGYSVRCIKN